METDEWGGTGRLKDWRRELRMRRAGFGVVWDFGLRLWSLLGPSESGSSEEGGDVKCKMSSQRYHSMIVSHDV